MKKKIIRSDWLFVGMLMHLAGIFIAATAYAYESMGALIVMALVMCGCGFFCSIQACKEAKQTKRVRARVRRINHSNAVQFCNQFQRNMEAEERAERLETKIQNTTENCLKVVGHGKDEFTKSADRIFRSVCQM